MSEKINVYRILYVKDIMSLLECSESHAKKVKNDIKEHFDIPLVLLKHFQDYLKV